MWEPNGIYGKDAGTTENQMGYKWDIWEPSGIIYPPGSRWVPCDKERRDPAGNPLWAPYVIPDGSLVSPIWCVRLGCGPVCQTGLTRCVSVEVLIPRVSGKITSFTHPISANFIDYNDELSEI